MVPVGQLINNNPRDKDFIAAKKIPAENNIEIQENLRHCKIMIINKKTIIGKDPDRGSYIVEMEMDTPKLNSSSNVRVMCTCKDFNFRWAYVLNKKGALLNPKRFDIAISNPPVITNAGQQTGCCKHVQYSINAILQKRLSEISPITGEI